MTNRWEDAEELLVAAADDDLCRGDTVQPAFVAFAGASLRFIAWLRPFAEGQHAEPLIELFALAGPLDCDRLMCSFAGRAWSLEDPIPPVTAGADLRQRVLVISAVDAADGDPRSWGAVHAFDLGTDGPTWGERRVLQGGEGWIPRAMEALVRRRDDMRAPLEEVARQARRVAALGHDLHLPPDMVALLAAHAPERG